MALIGKIRKNSWLLIVMLGLGLGGFIYMDMTSASNRAQATEFTVGEINGQKLDWNEFQRAERILYQNASTDVFGQRSYLWDYFTEDAIIRGESEKIGLNVGGDELEELQFGTNVSPVIERNFRNPTTNQLDRNNLNQFKQAREAGTLTPELAEFWDFQETEIVKDRLQSKLNNLIKKGIYAPTWMAEQNQKEMGSSLDFAYVQIPFDKADASQVNLTDEDYQNYMNENRVLFERDRPTKNVKYISFDVVPTAEDSVEISDKITGLIQAFTDAENDSSFVENNYGVMDAAFLKEAEVPLAIADTIFDIPVGSVYGPYVDEGQYKAVKVLNKKVIPDSVESRHILFRATPQSTQQQIIAVQNKADSIKNLIVTGAESFDSLAIRFSEDLGSGALGGDLGYAQPGMMVKPFNDAIFFQAEDDEIMTVYSQFGIHLVQVTGRKFINNDQGVQLAFLQEPIVPSETTQDVIYEEALDFVAQYRRIEDLEAAVEEDESMILETAPGLEENSYIFSNLGGGNTSRDIIRWAYDPSTEVGDVAPEVFTYEDAALYFNSKYVVPALASEVSPGLPAMEDVRDQIQIAVENKKKGELLAAAITDTNLESLASQYEVTVDTLNNVNFAMSYMQNVGSEPKILGHLDKMQLNDVAGPVVGANGVYVFKLTKKTAPSLSTDIPQLRRQIAQQMQSSVDFQLMDALKKAAKIVDDRYKYF